MAENICPSSGIPPSQQHSLDKLIWIKGTQVAESGQVSPPTGAHRPLEAGVVGGEGRVYDQSPRLGRQALLFFWERLFHHLEQISESVVPGQKVRLETMGLAASELCDLECVI